jgi:hypothetical protein
MPKRFSEPQTHSILTCRHVGGATVRVNIVQCACCDASIEKPTPNGKAYPMVAWQKFATRRGWGVNPRKEQFFCPEHKQ